MSEVTYSNIFHTSYLNELHTKYQQKDNCRVLNLVDKFPNSVFIQCYNTTYTFYTGNWCILAKNLVFLKRGSLYGLVGRRFSI